MREAVTPADDMMLPKPPGTISMPHITKRAPRRVYEGKFGTAVRDVEKYIAIISDCVKNMRKLCPIPEADFFFEQFKSYNRTVTSVIQDASKIIRKMTQLFSTETQSEPAYAVSERFMQSHTNFDIALRHLKVRTPSIFANTLLTLADQLETSFDRYVIRSRTAKSAQFGIIITNCESHFRQEMLSCRNTLKSLIEIVSFDQLNPQESLTLSDRYKRINRMFEADLYPSLRSVDPSLPEVSKTEWHRTFIQFIPLLTNAPLFNEQLEILTNNMPFLTNAIETFCSRLNVTSPMFKELTMFRNNTKEGVLQRMEGMVTKAMTFLEIPSDVTERTKVEQLEDVMSQAETTVMNLRNENKEKDKRIEELTQEIERARSDGIRARLATIREEQNKIAEKQRLSLTVQLNSIITHLRTLVSSEFNSEDEDPMRRFNSLFLALSREMNALRRENSKLTCDLADKTPKIREKLIQICQNLDENWNETEADLDTIVDHISDISKKNVQKTSLLNELCEIVGQDSKETQQTLTTAVKALKEYNSEMKETLVEICANTSNKSGDHFREKPISKLCEAARKHVNRSIEEYASIRKNELEEIRPGLSSTEDFVQTIKDEFTKNEYTSSAVEPITKLIVELNSMCDPSFKKYLPTSPDFTHYLDLVSSMKDVLHRIDPSIVIRPVHALLVQSVELFNSLAIALSSASFAPEYADHQAELAELIANYQEKVQSVQRLRVLLEEKDSLLTRETEKLIHLENKQDTSYSSESTDSSSAF